MTLSRRRLLTTLAATPAWAACAAVPPPIPERRFVGQTPERGHILRDRARMVGPVAERHSADVVIVGGGAAGMAAAWRLRRAGVESVRVLELEAGPGGTARGGTLPRSPYPMGAHYLPYPREDFRALHVLLADLGLVLGHDGDGVAELDPRVLCRAPVERHRFRGRWHEGIYPAYEQTDDERRQWEHWQAHLRELDERRGPDGRRLFALPVDDSSTALRHLDAISMAAYLDELKLDSWRLRWSIDYACRDDYGCTLAQTSAFAGLHHFLARGLEPEHEDRLLLTWPEGNARLVEGMAEHARLENRLHTNTAVLRIDPDEGRVLAYDITRQLVLELQADVVLWAAPRFVLSAVLPSGRDALPSGAIGYTPWLVVNVQVSAPPEGFGAPRAWDNVEVGAAHLGYVVANHQDPLTQRSSSAVLTYYEPWTADDAAGVRRQRQALFTATLDELSERAVSALDAMHPGLRYRVTHIDVARWGHAMVRPEPGFLFGEGRRTAAAPVGRVIPCAADVGGLPLFEEAFCGGVRGAEAAMRRLQELGRIARIDSSLLGPAP